VTGGNNLLFTERPGITINQTTIFRAQPMAKKTAVIQA